MKHFIIPAFFFLYSSTLLAQQVDILHYAFSIQVTDQNDSIQGDADIRLKLLKPTNNFWLDLASINNKKGMQVKNVSSGLPVTYVHAGNKIYFTTSDLLQRNDTLTLHISYAGIPADGLIIAKNKYNRRTFFADNWPDRAHQWLPCHDDPADKASVEFRVTAPDHYQVVSNGLQVEETNLTGNRKLTHWKEEQQLATKIMVIGIAEFAVQAAGTVNCIPVTSWVYPEDREKGFYDYAQATNILQWYISHIGSYGYSKLANVESKTIFGGMENASAIFYSENSINGKRSNETLLAHEIAHQWFGDMATEISFAHLWLSEGFATYLTIMYMEDKYGKDTLQAMLKEDRMNVIAFSKKSSLPVVDTTTKNYMQLLNANSYEKGGWVLHMLRRQLGDSIFRLAIKQYYAKYAGSNAGTSDLQHVFEQVSGRNLSAFFVQWLYKPDIPKLKINWQYNKNDQLLYLTVIQAQKTLLEFPLTVGISTPAGKLIKKQIAVSRASESFAIPVTDKPTAVMIDPDTELLFEEVQ